MSQEVRDARAAGRRTFGPVVLLGLAGGALAAVAGNKPWAVAEDDSQSTSAMMLMFDSGEMPTATGLALVALACWGVVLVTRRRVRRVVAVLAALASAGVLVSVVVGFSSTADAVRSDLEGLGLEPQIGHTGWYWAALIGAVLSLAASVLAVRLVPTWPEMGSRYDAPTGAAPQQAAAPEDRSNLDLWKAMDEGQDPTA
ncbi:Trp biosynthesis-associated membrane protein [Nocardioides pantholopis]|uniref:Trp biosynthesis-associated membrane protein n=1 Tax=Nocardioides pantholopis TaxID=2483798 RepID=UPI0013DDCB79|nr:Trp biosynthesis-associated membrane protein [Nocardioides pantholopis]